jgi:RNA polymerase sigma-70 factor (ECF subfamily)
MLQPEEVSWVQQAQTGDRDAFSRLVDRYWERLCRWLFALTGRRDVAEDITQEAFLRAWSALPRLQGTASFRVWLFRIGRNCLLTRVRGLRGKNVASLPADLSGASDNPLENILEREGQQLLMNALARLPVGYRMAYLLWTQEELPYSKIAEVLAVTEETARWRVCKARQFLFKELKMYLDVESP